eukprot:scaffold594_cov71-Skeletonema_dohrnii-CCMP3373.AAC.3
MIYSAAAGLEMETKLKLVSMSLALMNLINTNTFHCHCVHYVHFPVRILHIDMEDVMMIDQ